MAEKSVCAIGRMNWIFNTHLAWRSSTQWVGKCFVPRVRSFHVYGAIDYVVSGTYRWQPSFQRLKRPTDGLNLRFDKRSFFLVRRVFACWPAPVLQNRCSR